MNHAEQNNETEETEIVDDPNIGLLSGFSRRMFIRGSVGLAAAGAAIAAVPGFSGALAVTENEAPGAEDAASTAVEEGAATGTSSFAEPLIAHVKDLQTGEMSLYFGENEVIVKDPGLASRLVGAARR
jgi:hypothetical protein